MKTIYLRVSKLAVLAGFLMAGGLLLPAAASATPISF